MTGLAGFAWLFYSMIQNDSIEFMNDSIQYQLPLLISVVIMKFSILWWNKFKTHSKLFKTNVYGYGIFVLAVLVLDYKDYLFGGSAPGPAA